MERIFLYYPTIDIPQKEWLYNAILYSDKVSSILPNKDEWYLPDTLRDLIDKGQYMPIFINDLLEKYTFQFKKYEQKFIKAVDDPRFNSQRSNTIRDSRFKSVFQDKVTHFVLRELEKRDMITKLEDRFILPENAAIYYMSILAQFVAEVYESDDIVIPSTDYQRFTNITFDSIHANKESMNVIFKNCLPVPDLNVPISEILKFKKNHRDELLRFRKFLDKLNILLLNARDNIDLKEILISKKESIELEMSDLNELYRRNSIRTVISTMDSLLSLENPKLFESLLAIGVLTTAINPVVGVSIAGLSVGVKFIDQYNENKEKLKKTELNYLFKAKKSGIIK